jgi:hypothetical protein
MGRALAEIRCGFCTGQFHVFVLCFIVVAAVIPLGPPHRCLVVESCAFRERARSVAEYPSVIATTNSAPGNSGGLGTGMSK